MWTKKLFNNLLIKNDYNIEEVQSEFLTIKMIWRDTVNKSRIRKKKHIIVNFYFPIQIAFISNTMIDKNGPLNYAVPHV